MEADLKSSSSEYKRLVFYKLADSEITLLQIVLFVLAQR